MSSVELLKYVTTSDDLDSLDSASDHALNGELRISSGDEGELKLVYLEKDGSGPPALSVLYSHSAPAPVASDNAASEEKAQDLLQEVRELVVEPRPP